MIESCRKQSSQLLDVLYIIFKDFFKKSKVLLLFKVDMLNVWLLIYSVVNKFQLVEINEREFRLQGVYFKGFVIEGLFFFFIFCCLVEVSR